MKIFGTRAGVFAGVVALLLSVSSAAHAQYWQDDTTSGNGTYMARPGNAAPPIYNAPQNTGRSSYNYSTNAPGPSIQPYTGFGSRSSSGGSPASQQSADQAIQNFRNYLAGRQQQNAQQPAPYGNTGSAFGRNTMFGNPRFSGDSGAYDRYGSDDYYYGGQEPVKKKRRVVYGERNNPLVEPPRLFDPDQ